MAADQYDLFATPPPARPAGGAERPAVPSPNPSDMNDHDLIAALDRAGLAECRALAGEAGRRRLKAAIPALAALCRRHAGFGVAAPVSEQLAALAALAAIGGAEAAQAVVRAMARGEIQGPTLVEAVAAAVTLEARLPEAVVAGLLRHDRPAVRAYACGLVRTWPALVPPLRDLLDDLNPAVRGAAACALGRLGRSEARPALARLLRNAPSPEIVEAIAGVADEECLVLLGRTARSTPALAEQIIEVLDESDDERAATIAGALRRWRTGAN